MSTLASYDGLSLFGPIVNSNVYPEPWAVQENTYPGVTGIESLALGGRGGRVEISGVLGGTNLSNLVSNYATIVSYNDGTPRVLVDTMGISYAYAICGPIEWADRPMTDTWTGNVYRKYKVAFRVLL